MSRLFIKLIKIIIAPFFALIILCEIFIIQFKKRPLIPRLVWGPVPLVSNKYWSKAMHVAHYESKTIMYPPYSINSELDFDIYIHKFIKIPEIGPYISKLLGPYIAFIFSLWKYEIFHHPASGGFLSNCPLWRYEALFLKMAGKKRLYYLMVAIFISIRKLVIQPYATRYCSLTLLLVGKKKNFKLASRTGPLTRTSLSPFSRSMAAADGT